MPTPFSVSRARVNHLPSSSVIHQASSKSMASVWYLSARPLLSSGSLYAKPRLFSYSRSSSPYPFRNPNKLGRKVERGICRAGLSHEAPLATAIGACILSSFVLPVAKRVGDEEDDDSSAIVSTDLRLVAMGIISFIPYFNWLSWVFAWLDTGKRRYGVYALVYLLPYLSSNLSISPEESWLPITSIVLGIIHVQLEASIANGDLQTFQIFENISENLSSKKRIHFDRHHGHTEEKDNKRNLPLGDQNPRNEIHRPRKPRRRKEQNSSWSDNEEK